MPTPRVNRTVIFGGGADVYDAAPGGDPAAFRSMVTHDGDSGTPPNPHVVPMPAGVEDDDILFMVLVNQNTLRTLTTPDGWTLVDGSPVDSPNNDARTWVLYRVASSEPADYNVSFSAATQLAAAVLAYTPGNTAAPINSSNTGPYGPSTFTPTAPLLEPTQENCVILGIFGADNSGAVSWTPPIGYTERVDFETASGFIGIHVAEKTQTLAVPERPRASWNSSDEGCAFTIAVAPTSP